MLVSNAVIQFSLKQSLGAVLGASPPQDPARGDTDVTATELFAAVTLSSLPALPCHVLQHSIHLPTLTTHPGYAARFQSVQNY